MTYYLLKALSPTVVSCEEKTKASMQEFLYQTDVTKHGMILHIINIVDSSGQVHPASSHFLYIKFCSTFLDTHLVIQLLNKISTKFH